MPQTPDRTLARLDALIERHLADADYSLEALCADLGLSRSQLFRIVKQQTGLSVSRYWRQRRLHRARELLATTDLRIAEIADQTGHDSPQGFSKAFSEEVGVSPSEYRKTVGPNGLPDAEPPPAPAEAAPNALPPKADTPRVRQKPWLRGGALAGLALLVGFYFWRASADWATATEGNSIAILPFRNVGPPANAPFAEGLMSQLHAALAASDRLSVTSKTSSLLFRDSKKTAPEIADELGVRYVLEGTVTEINRRVSVGVVLIRASDDRVVWTKTLDLQPAEGMAAMNRMANDVGAAVYRQVGLTPAGGGSAVPTLNVAAYNACVQGQTLAATRTNEKLVASLGLFDQAIALDPQFAEAHAFRASACFALGNSGYIPLDSSFRLAEKSALTALRLDGETGLAYAILACVYRDRYQWEQAHTAYRIALEKAPNDAMTNYWYGLMLRSVGQFDEALRYSTKAVELDPLSPVIFAGHLRNCVHARRGDLVRQCIERGNLVFGDSFLYYYARATGYCLKSDYASALRDVEKAHQLNPSAKGLAAERAFLHGRLGRTGAVRAYLDSLPARPDHQRLRALAHAGLRDRENCLRALEAYAATGRVPIDVKVTPEFAFLHQDPRFRALLHRFGLLDARFEVEEMPR